MKSTEEEFDKMYGEVYVDIDMALTQARDLLKRLDPNRERALAITKLEEAAMWLYTDLMGAFR